MDVLPHYMLVCYTFGGEWDKENVKQNLKTIGISGLTHVGVQRNLLKGLLWIFFFFCRRGGNRWEIKTILMQGGGWCTNKC